MANNFDELLKKGKGNATNLNTNENKWKEIIATLMHSLHQLNSMYGNNKQHHLKVEPNKCKTCGEASFVIAIRSLSEKGKATRYHKSKWQCLENHKYLCDKCKKS